MKLFHTSVRLIACGMLALSLLCLFPAPCSAEEPGWNPKRTWVFAVGVLKWKDKQSYSSFTSKNRRDAELVSFFSKARSSGRSYRISPGQGGPLKAR